MNNPDSILPPQEKALLFLCRPDLSDEELDLLRKNLNEIRNWQSMLQLLNDHGIIALTRHNLNKYGLIEIVPHAEREMMHKAYLKNIARNTAIFSLFNEVAEIALKNKIKIIPIKGLLLEKTVYGNSGLRQMNDLDILVPPGDAMKMRNALISEGFSTIPFISPIHSFFLHSYGKHMPEMYRNGLNVEIHFRLFRDRHNSFTRELINLSTLQFPDGNSFTFTPPILYNFIYLVKHLRWHEKTGNSQLRLYCDLVFLIAQHGEEILNDELFSITRELKMEEELHIVLALLEKYFRINTGVTNVIPDNEDNKFRKFLSHPKNNSPEEKRGPFTDQVENIEGIHHKILYSIGMLFPSLSFMKWRYNTGTRLKALLFYPKRWFEFFRKIFNPTQ